MHSRYLRGWSHVLGMGRSERRSTSCDLRVRRLAINSVRRELFPYRCTQVSSKSKSNGFSQAHIQSDQEPDWHTNSLTRANTHTPIDSCSQDPCGNLAECWDLERGGALCECHDGTEVGFFEDCPLDSINCPQGRVIDADGEECVCPPETPEEDNWGFCFATGSTCLDNPCMGVGSTCHDDDISSESGYIFRCTDDSTVSATENCAFATITSCDAPNP
jgi:hypothetical protein